ncbi:diguanylate cyclase [Aquisalibacillus elongatus]|uniref:Diguanylate cyclase (GGDEF)-like protein n=1 Tax=Aquisalibacillus elongatus TaxID=485577 RepID=A0A3N5B6J5_9BACI|nr:diguanylate cyclase [Aquisalibacillus elongatus]RPF53316.1 diguanylate cyclase (GGDEF)-like protein [Aquisalibacillus elongatus]
MKQAKWLLLPMIILLFGFFWANHEENTVPNFGGQFNLPESMEGEVYSLQGKWMLFPDQLLEPSESVYEGYDVRLVDMPHSFDDYEYATYQANITLPPDAVNQLMSFYIPNIESAHKVWVNGKLLAEEGEVGTDYESTTPAKRGRVLDYYPESRMLTITVQMSNFHYNSSGLWTDVLIGDDAAVDRLYTLDRSLSMIVIGSLFVLLLYYLFSFLVQGRNLYHLYFIVLVFFVMVRLSLEGDKLLYDLFPQFPWYWADRLEYLSFIWLLPLFSYVISFMYSKHANFKFTRVYFILMFLVSAFIVFLPVSVFTDYLVLFQATLIFGFIYIFWVVYRAYLDGEPFAFINLMALFVLLLTGFNDAFYYNEWVNTQPILSLGFLFYLLIQTIILAVQHAQTVERYKQSSEDLSFLNQKLEEKVQARTNELEKSQKELLEKNRFLQKISYLDELTQIPNRRSFVNVLEKDVADAKDKGESIAILFIDLDLFKKINDQYGHQMGDVCLKILAELLNQHFNDIGGFVARYGGEEFVAITKGQTVEELNVTAEKLRERVTDLKVPGLEVGELSVSIGVGFDEIAKLSGDALMKRADEALYHAKNNGRNQVVIYTED